MKFSRIVPIGLLLAGAAAAQLAPPPPPAPVAAPAAPTPAPDAKPMLAPAAAPLAPLPPLPPDVYVDIDPVIAGDIRVALNLDMQEKVEMARDKVEAMRDKLADMRIDMPLFAQVAPPAPPASPKPMAFPAGVKIRTMNDDRAYEAGQRALEGRRYSEALEYFNEVATRGKDRADGALYWKAYTLLKLGRADEARAAIAELRRTYASSRWLDDAKALEVEAGKPVTPESESDEELKLIALNGLMQSDPDRALPLLDTLLKSAQPPRIKRNALFVLAQSNSPKAQQTLEQVARGQGNPDLQVQAVRYLGERRRNGASSPVLAEIYGSSNDVNVKRAVLTAFESARDKDRLLQIAKTERDPDLRLLAIRLLGSIQGAQADVWGLYNAETNADVKQRILETIPASGNQDKMLEIAKAERDPKLRRFAVQTLSSPRAAGTGDALATMYASEQDPNVKRAIVDALGSQRNVKAMVQVARSEKDPRMQQHIVERLAGMKSPEATEYLMEIIKK